MTSTTPKVFNLLVKNTKTIITNPKPVHRLFHSNRFNSSPSTSSSTSTSKQFYSTSSSSSSSPSKGVPIGKLSQGLGFDSSSARASGSNSSSSSHAGPFPMPDMASRDASIRNEGKKWKQLKGSEKVGVVATQSWSLVVVLIGAAVAGAVIYSTGTELFSDNSPTRIFEDCVERVKASEELKSILIEPYQFHGQNSSNRLRRNRRISSSLSVDPIDGSETLLVRFWIESTPLPTDPASIPEVPWFDTVKSYVSPLIYEDTTKAERYIPRPSSAALAIKEAEKEREAEIAKEANTWGGWVQEGIYSVFGGIIPRPQKKEGDKKTGTANLFTRKSKRPKRGEHTSGEVIAELKKDPSTGNFEYKRLYVDIPDARAADRYRIKIPTDVVGESTKGLDRIRIWYRKTTSA